MARYFGIPLRNSVGLGLGGAAGLASAQSSTPINLFLNGEQGAWYDPSDFSSLYQDAAGTTAVTAVEQAVGLMLDKRLGLPLGTQLVVNPTFATDSDWTKGTGWSIGSGVATKTAGTASVLGQTMTLTAGVRYRIVFTLTRTAGSINIQFTGGSTVANATVSASGSYVQFLTAAAGNTTFEFAASSGFAGTVDDVYIRPVSGNDAYQITSAARPILRARYNQLTYSEQFDNGDWVKTNITPSSNTDTAPDGTLTADTLAATSANGTALQSLTALAASYTFSVWLKRKTGTGNIDITAGSGTYVTQTVTSSWTRFTVTQTLTAGSRSPGIRIVTSGDEVYAWGAQFLPANTVTGNAYQRIADAATYVTISTMGGYQFLPYLSFDGTDDWMLTQTQDWSTTSKATVWAGLTKLADVSGILEEGPGLSLLISTFGRYSVVSNGTGTLVTATAATNTSDSPITNVLTALGDIDNDICRLFQNRVQIANSTTDQGVGVYRNATLRIGAREGTPNTQFMNGRLYSLILRAASSDASQIASTELYVASKCGVVL